MATIKNMSTPSIAALNSGRKELKYGKDRNAVAATSAEVTPATLAINVGQVGKVVADVLPADSIQRGTWTVSAEGIVSIAEDTFTTAQDVNVTALAAGSVTLTFTSEDGSFTDTCAVTVTDPSVVAVTGVTVVPTTAALAVAGTQQLTPTVAPSNATNKAVTYSTSNAAIATVNSSGLITAVAAGSATITVTTADGSHTATCAVTVS